MTQYIYHLPWQSNAALQGNNKSALVEENIANTAQFYQKYFWEILTL